MKIKFTILFILFFALHFAQNINDKSFDNVINIGEKDIRNVDKHYIFGLPISKESQKTPVIFLGKKMSSDLLSTIYPEFEKIIVITSNYFRKPSSGKPTESSIIYEFTRKNRLVQKDSLVLKDGFPEMNFAKPLELKKNEKQIFFSENVGYKSDSISKKKFIPERFIKYFKEQKHTNISIGNVYIKSEKDKNNQIYYYTFNTLTDKDMISFIFLNLHMKIPDAHLIKMLPPSPQIFTPQVIDIKNCELVTF